MLQNPTDRSGQAVESSVRQLIANGKFKTALDSAKQFHKAKPTAASEALLLDAYAARIQALLDRNLATEAKSLLDLVRERFPSARARLDDLKAKTSARGGDLAELLQPLNDPELSAERRAAIEQIVQNQVADLAALAGCAGLPPEHRLRQAAAALDRAFNAVTSGPVAEEQIALPEVSHRSPLAPWKLLIRAIACLHRGEDEACRGYLDAIQPESVPARLVPAMLAMLGAAPAAALKPAEAALLSRTGVNLSALRGALANLDRAFQDVHGGSESRIFKAVRAAVGECRNGAPDRLVELKQRIAVRAGVECLDNERLMAALDGAPRADAAYFRMYARALEKSGEQDDRGEACELWDRFRLQAVREGWFPADGVEVAALYLHMAELLGTLPDELLRDLQRPGGSKNKPDAADDRYYLFPAKLYARACAIDPHPEAFSQWMHWAAGRSVSEGENVAREWHEILPDNIEPLLYLMEQAEKRSAFPTALSYLEKAERIDAVHSAVRAGRLRLLASAAMRHLQQKKPHLAAKKLAAMEALPQSRQGDRPAFLAALRYLIGRDSGALLEVGRLLGDAIAAEILVFGVATASKCLSSGGLRPVNDLRRDERTAIPASLARTMALARDLGIAKFPFPIAHLEEAEAQFAGVSDALDAVQIRLLADLGLSTGYLSLAWAASGAGLKRGGPSEARFMLLRARAIPAGFGQRYLALAAAALELGRFHRDMDVVDKAVEIVRNPYGGDSISLTAAQAREVVRKELASPAFPSRSQVGPDYRDLMPREEPCQCPDCRRRRGETSGPFDEIETEDGDEFDDDEMRRIFDDGAPEGLPPEMANMLFEVLKEALINGESPDAILSRLTGAAGGRKKGRRKR